MTSTTRIIITALAMLAFAVPAANAMPLYEHGDTTATGRASTDIRTSSLAGTTSTPQQDLRNADQRAPQPAEPTQDLRNPDNRAPGVEAAPAPTDTSRIPVQQSPYSPAQLKPISTPQAAPVADDGPSPFVYIIPSVVLIALLGAGFAFMKTSRPVRRSAA
jgi:hypothetical protein